MISRRFELDMNSNLSACIFFSFLNGFDDFWDDIKEDVVKRFKKEKYVKGLCEGIKKTGKALKKYFPHQEDDVNELPDEISYS